MLVGRRPSPLACARRSGLALSLAFVALPRLSTLASAAPAVTGFDTTNRVVVMIQSSAGGQGSGIVFNKTGSYLYIVTANHVVRDQYGSAYGGVKVLFNQDPGKQYDGEVLDDYDANLDLAVVRVVSTTLQGESFPFSILGDAAGVTAGAEVYEIGWVADTKWNRNFNPDRVGLPAAATVDIQTSFVDSGASGGPVVDTQGHILGMVRKVEGHNALALLTAAIVATLRAWHYEVSLSPFSASTNVASGPPAAALVGEGTWKNTQYPTGRSTYGFVDSRACAKYNGTEKIENLTLTMHQSTIISASLNTTFNESFEPPCTGAGIVPPIGTVAEHYSMHGQPIPTGIGFEVFFEKDSDPAVTAALNFSTANASIGELDIKNPRADAPWFKWEMFIDVPIARQP